MRRDKLNGIVLAQESVEKSARLGGEPSPRSVAALAEAALPASPYSSMAKDLLADW